MSGAGQFPMAERLIAAGCSYSSPSLPHFSFNLNLNSNLNWVRFRAGSLSQSCSRFVQGSFSLLKHCRIVHTGTGGHLFKIRAAKAPDDGVKWWEKDGPPNMRDVHSTEEFIEALANAGDKLVIVEFFATWCGSCRALYPKLCKIAEVHNEIEFLKVNFEENKPMCKRLGIRVLPYFHFYRGADGRLDGFSCSLAKLQKLKDAIEMHNSDRCSLGPTLGVGDLLSTSPTDQATPAGSTR